MGKDIVNLERALEELKTRIFEDNNKWIFKI